MANLQNPVQAIRAKCIDCCCGQVAEVKLCPAEDCPIWPFRLGKNPFRAKREMTDEQRERMRAVLDEARKKKEQNQASLA